MAPPCTQPIFHIDDGEQRTIRDVITQSGIGKTDTIALSILRTIKTSSPRLQALILSPTTELAIQIVKVLLAIGNIVKVNAHACIDGENLGEDIRKLEHGVQVVSGTPGLICDIMHKGLCTTTIKFLVLDELDEMLNLGFKDKIYDIYEHLPSELQVVLVSAGLHHEVLEFATNCMIHPVRIEVNPDELTLKGFRQYFIAVEKEEWKLQTLCGLYDSLTITQAVIFCNTRAKVLALANEMRRKGHQVFHLHGGASRQAREEYMNKFRFSATPVLITTDEMAREIEVQKIFVVINFDLPKSREHYIYRVGRSGRFGSKGVVVSFVCRDDIPTLRVIEAYYGTQTDMDGMPMDATDVIYPASS